MNFETIPTVIPENIDTLKGLLIDACKKFQGDAAFFVKAKNKADPFEKITYEKLRADIITVGNALLKKNLQGKTVAVVGENSYQWVVAYHAAIFIDAVIVPLDKELGDKEIKNLTKKADVSAIFFTDKHFDTAADLDLEHKFRMKKYYAEESKISLEKNMMEFKTLEEEGRGGLNEDDILNIKIDPDKLALVMFTSGTTGDAKGVMLTQRNIATNIRDMQACIKIRRGDKTVSILPMHHCFESRMGIQAILSAGGQVAIGDGLKDIYKNMQDIGANHMACVPLILESFYKRVWRAAVKDGKETSLKKRVQDYKDLRNEYMQGLPLNSGDEILRKNAKAIFSEEQKVFGGELRQIFTGAAKGNAEVIGGLQDIGIKIIQGYGMTEMTALLSSVRYDENSYSKLMSVGRVVPSSSCFIDNEDEDGIGEIVAKGPIRFLGYLENPEATKKVRKEDVYYTGDYGYIDKDGEIFVTGRKTNMIVTATGKNIFPEELEADLLLSEYINEIMIYGAEKENKSGLIVTAQVRVNREALAEKIGDLSFENIFEEIKNMISEYNDGLANYKRIRHLIIREDDFIKTPTGKIRRGMNIDPKGLNVYSSEL